VMDEVADLLLRIYECLGGQASVRSLVYAAADVRARAQLGGLSWEKLVDIIAQNLAGALRASPGAARKIVEDAIACAKRSPSAEPAVMAWGSVGSERAPTLAHIVNRHVRIDASPRAKLEVIKRLNLPREALEEARSPIAARSEGVAHVKSAVRLVKRYRPSAPPSDIDLLMTAMSFMKKRLMGRPLSDDDIHLREYTHIIDKPVYIALDVSGSMKEYVGSATKLRVAKNAIARYIRQMAYLRGFVALALFNVDADFMWTPHAAHTYSREMIEILRYVYAMGGTELASALELLHAHGATRDVVIISDGRTSDADRVLQIARKFRRLHVVATERSGFLRQLARLTGGRYRELAPGLDLLSLYG